MPIRNVPNGYLYVMTTEFGPDQVVTISKSQHDPHELINKANQKNKFGLGGLKPAEILYAKELPNCHQIESLVHQFLINNDYCAVTPKDYQIHFQDAIKLIETAIEDEYLDPHLVLECKNTKCIPTAATNYFRLGSIFDGSYAEANGDLLEPFQIDFEAAFCCYYKGYEMEDDRCTPTLAQCYEDGIGVEQNHKKSLKLYEEIYQYDRFKGIESMYRIYLKENNDFKVSALLLDFFNWCEREIVQDSFSLNDKIDECMDIHKTFIRILGSFVWESFYHVENFDVLKPFIHYFKDFRHSLFKRLENDSRILESQRFYEMSEKLNFCTESFEKFLQEDHQSAA